MEEEIEEEFRAPSPIRGRGTSSFSIHQQEGDEASDPENPSRGASLFGQRVVGSNPPRAALRPLAPSAPAPQLETPHLVRALSSCPFPFHHSRLDFDVILCAGLGCVCVVCWQHRWKPCGRSINRRPRSNGCGSSSPRRARSSRLPRAQPVATPSPS
jgi:hypothetical protein